MPNKLTYFQESWLSGSRFESWVSRSKDKGNAWCKLCKKDIMLSNMGERALLSHARGSKHNTKVEDRKTARDFLK